MAKQISRISNNTNKSSFILVTKQSKTSTNCDNLTTNRHRCLLFLSLPTTSMLTHNFSFPHWSPLFLHSIIFEEWQHEWWVCQCMGWETHPSCYHSMTTLESSKVKLEDKREGDWWGKRRRRNGMDHQWEVVGSNRRDRERGSIVAIQC